MRATKGSMGLILVGLLLLLMCSTAMGKQDPGTSDSATTQLFPALSVKDYECQPAAEKSISELQRLEKRLTESEHLLSKYKQFGKEQQRVPAILFVGAAEDISTARRKHGREWKEHFQVQFPRRVSWGLLERYLNGYWSSWIDKDEAESFVFKRSLVPNRSNFGTWFRANVWTPAQERTEDLFSRYEQKTVNPLRLRWAVLITGLAASGLCQKKSVLSRGADCSQMLALVKKTMHRDLSDASELYVRLEGADKAEASGIPRKLLQKMKEWKSRAVQARNGCPEVAEYIDNALNMWLCTVGPSGAENLEIMCGMIRPTSSE